MTNTSFKVKCTKIMDLSKKYISEIKEILIAGDTATNYIV